MNKLKAIGVNVVQTIGIILGVVTIIVVIFAAIDFVPKIANNLRANAINIQQINQNRIDSIRILNYMHQDSLKDVAFQRRLNAESNK